jgi:hypothetical protein
MQSLHAQFAPAGIAIDVSKAGLLIIWYYFSLLVV